MSRCAAVSAASLISPLTAWADSDDEQQKEWLAMSEDPVYKMISGTPDLDKILGLFPRTTGKPAFDPERIAENVERLQTTPAVNTGHPFLDLSVKVGLAHIDPTFRGDHPRYGVGTYGATIHDGFPPTIIAAVDALTAWGMGGRAIQLFRHWLGYFVRDDGTIKYYGPSISEYGQLLHTAALLEERAGGADWWNDGFAPLNRMAEYLLQLRAAAGKDDGLISGVPEADTRKDTAKYFHNNAWAAKGLRRWADLCDRMKASPTTASDAMRKASAELAKDTLQAIQNTWPADPADWWLSPQLEPVPKPGRLLGDSRAGSYTNYRYWPELLSSGLLPKEMANRVVASRLSAGGQFCGMTRLGKIIDDWPLADYLYGVWALGRKDDFLLSLYGHISYHQAEGHLTAYESVSFPPGKKGADYCLPSQLVAARATRLLQQ
jgi:hypothetical protein